MDVMNDLHDQNYLYKAKYYTPKTLSPYDKLCMILDMQEGNSVRCSTLLGYKSLKSIKAGVARYSAIKGVAWELTSWKNGCVIKKKEEYV